MIHAPAPPRRTEFRPAWSRRTGPPSVMVQGHQRIHSGSTRSRNVGRDDCHHAEYDRATDECDRVGRGQAEEKGRHQHGGGAADDEPERDATADSMTLSRTNMRNTSLGRAPMAMRMPTSRVRSHTLWAATP